MYKELEEESLDLILREMGQHGRPDSLHFIKLHGQKN